MRKSSLVLGDAATVAIITVIGFVTHDRVGISYLSRAAALAIPLLIVWFVLASRLRLFEPAVVLNPRQLWRPAVAMIGAVPLALVIRAAILAAEVTPIFMLVLGGITALGITIWRGIFLWLARKA